MQTKKIWKSKTFWINVIALIAAILAPKGIVIEAEFQAEMVAAIMAVMNIMLRFMTKVEVRL